MVTLVTRCRTFSPSFWRQTTWTFVCYYTKILSHSPIEFVDLNNNTNLSTLIMKRRVLQFCIQARGGQVRVAEAAPIVCCGVWMKTMTKFCCEEASHVSRGLRIMDQPCDIQNNLWRDRASFSSSHKVRRSIHLITSQHLSQLVLHPYPAVCQLRQSNTLLRGRDHFQ